MSLTAPAVHLTSTEANDRALTAKRAAILIAARFLDGDEMVTIGRLVPQIPTSPRAGRAIPIRLTNTG
jgi:hypothetical protein